MLTKIITMQVSQRNMRQKSSYVFGKVPGSNLGPEVGILAEDT
jgi:hypothetical protein